MDTITNTIYLQYSLSTSPLSPLIWHYLANGVCSWPMVCAPDHMYMYIGSRNVILCLAVTHMPWTQPALLMKCVCCFLVSNDNIKEIYSHAIHSNRNRVWAYTDVLRYTVRHHAKYWLFSAIFCPRVSRIDWCRENLSLAERRSAGKGYREKVDGQREGGSRRTEREEEGQHHSRKCRMRGNKKVWDRVWSAASLALLHEVNKLPKSKASWSSIIPKWEEGEVEWVEDEGGGGTEWDRGEWVKV